MNLVEAHEELFVEATAGEQHVTKDPGNQQGQEDPKKGPLSTCHFPSPDLAFSFLIFVFY